jgi:Arc/MetJ family transcription regulator
MALLPGPALLSPSGYTGDAFVYTGGMAKHLVDIDEETLDAARAELGTKTIKDTVNEALRRATSRRARRVAAALDVLGSAQLDDRAEAWR